jgi:citronellol/citronellal dehydrogenase
MPGKLSGQIAFVTGGSRGIGRNIALQLAKEGANVVVAARTEEENEKLPGTIYSVAKEIEALGTGAAALPLKLNLVDDDSIHAAAERAVAELGRVDALINNAGVRPLTKALQLPMRHFDLVWKVNVRGAFLLTQLLAPPMLERGSGAVINISSRVARAGAEDRVIYAITKRADELIIETLEIEEGGKGVRFFSLQPERMVATEGAHATGVVREGVEMEPPEAMGQAAAWLVAEAPAALSGKHFFSGALLRDVAAGRSPTPIAT